MSVPWQIFGPLPQHHLVAVYIPCHLTWPPRSTCPIADRTRRRANTSKFRECSYSHLYCPHYCVRSSPIIRSQHANFLLCIHVGRILPRRDGPPVTAMRSMTPPSSMPIQPRLRQPPTELLRLRRRKRGKRIRPKSLRTSRRSSRLTTTPSLSRNSVPVTGSRTPRPD